MTRADGLPAASVEAGLSTDDLIDSTICTSSYINSQPRHSTTH